MHLEITMLCFSNTIKTQTMWRDKITYDLFRNKCAYIHTLLSAASGSIECRSSTNWEHAARRHACIWSSVIDRIKEQNSPTYAVVATTCQTDWTPWLVNYMYSAIPTWFHAKPMRNASNQVRDGAQEEEEHEMAEQLPDLNPDKHVMKAVLWIPTSRLMSLTLFSGTNGRSDTASWAPDKTGQVHYVEVPLSKILAPIWCCLM